MIAVMPAKAGIRYAAASHSIDAGGYRFIRFRG